MTILERLDRLESIHAIEQLAVRYALAMDARDIEAWLDLFVHDVDCGKRGRGREALRGFIEPALSSYYRTIHLVCGHRIVFDEADRAHGNVYCRAEHEAKGQWIVMAVCYADDYARRDGEWRFLRRVERYWYAVDVLERPNAPFNRWDWMKKPPSLPEDFPSWEPFWHKFMPEGPKSTDDLVGSGGS